MCEFKLLTLNNKALQGILHQSALKADWRSASLRWFRWSRVENGEGFNCLKFGLNDNGSHPDRRQLNILIMWCYLIFTFSPITPYSNIVSKAARAHHLLQHFQWNNQCQAIRRPVKQVYLPLLLHKHAAFWLRGAQPGCDITDRHPSSWTVQYATCFWVIRSVK